MKRFMAVLTLAIVFISCSERKDKPQSLQVKEFTSPATDSCADPFLFTDKSGKIYLSWVEKKGKESTLMFSTFSKDKWTDAEKIASGNNWFVNWADYPVISTDGKNNLIAHYLEKSAASTYAYDVKYVTSADQGKSWVAPKTLHDDGKQAEHGFVSMAPYGDQYFVSWLDGRNTGSDAKSGHEGHHGQMTLRGAIVSSNGAKDKEWELDNRVCDCCQTCVAITKNGPIVVYRDRSEEEIRDMSIVRYVNGQWTEPKPIYSDNWKIAGCPVNGPRADAIGNNLAIAWFSMADKKSQVKVVFSEDGGATFKAPIQIDENNSIGRVDIVMLDNKSAMVSWMEGADIKAVKVNSDGTKGASIMIASSSESRSSGFPQMTKSGNTLYFAWTDDKARTVKVASLSL